MKKRISRPPRFLVPVAEIFGEGKAGERHAGTCARGFVHLAENQGDVGFLQFFVVDFGQVPAAFFHIFQEFFAILDNARFDHFAEQVVPFTGTFTDTAEDRHTGVYLGDVVDELHDDNGLAHTGAAEQADLAAFCIRLDQVDDLDPGVKHFLAGGQVFKHRGLAVDGVGFFPLTPGQGRR